jgi:hypothetical protein
MFPFIILPLALALGVAAHDAPHPAERAAADSTVAANVDEPVVIQFDNQAWDMATVYALPQSGMAIRLGQVNPGSTARFVLPRGATAGSGVVNIVAVPFGRRFTVRSGPVSVTPGDRLSASLSPSENNISVLPAR